MGKTVETSKGDFPGFTITSLSESFHEACFPSHQLNHCFLMLWWDLLTFVLHLTFLNATHRSGWEGWLGRHHDEHWFWQMYPSLCPSPGVAPWDLLVGQSVFHCHCWGLPLPPRTHVRSTLWAPVLGLLNSQFSNNFPPKKICWHELWRG